MRRTWLIWLGVTLALAAGARDVFDGWVDATVLPDTVVIAHSRCVRAAQARSDR